MTTQAEATRRARQLGRWYEEWASRQDAGDSALDGLAPEAAFALVAGDDFHAHASEVMGLTAPKQGPVAFLLDRVAASRQAHATHVQAMADLFNHPGHPDQKVHGRRTGRESVLSQLADLATQLDAGQARKREVGHGQNGIVQEVSSRDGKAWAIAKYARSGVPSIVADAPPLTAKHQQDAEMLAAAVGEAIGVRVPATYRMGQDSVLFERIEGDTIVTEAMYAGRAVDSFAEEAANGDAGIRVGLLDSLIHNGDRHNENLMIDGGAVIDGASLEEAIVAIDHGQAFQLPPAGASAMPADNPFGLKFHGRDGNWNADNPLSQEDITVLTERLSSLRPAFEELDRPDWHDMVMANLAEIAKGANSSGRLIR